MNLCHEIWKPIEGFEGFYEVSNLGRVKSLGRIDRFNRRWSERFLKPFTNHKGYFVVVLCKDGITKHRPIHRLVATAFIPNPYKKPQVNHIDGNKSNNRSENLEWCTNSENQLHARNAGLNPVTMNNPIHSKAVDMCKKDGTFIKTFPSISEASRNVGVAVSNISYCCKHSFGKYTACGFAWKYSEGGESNVS